MQKTQKCFYVFFFRDPPSGDTNFNLSPCPPPFENFLLDALNSKQKPSAKNLVDWAGQKPVDWPVNRRRF